MISPPKIIAIDGNPGSGKTTLGRFLAWHFNVTLLETDLFLIPQQEKLNYLTEQIQRIIEARLRKPRPIIVEGCAILRLLENCGRVPDFLIFLKQEDSPADSPLEKEIWAYVHAYTPVDRADLVLELKFS